MLVTTQLLTDLGACSPQKNLFTTYFPNGLDSGNLDSFEKALEIGLDIEWFISAIAFRLLDVELANHIISLFSCNCADLLACRDLPRRYANYLVTIEDNTSVKFNENQRSYIEEMYILRMTRLCYRTMCKIEQLAEKSHPITPDELLKLGFIYEDMEYRRYINDIRIVVTQKGIVLMDSIFGNLFSTHQVNVSSMEELKKLIDLHTIKGKPQ